MIEPLLNLLLYSMAVAVCLGIDGQPLLVIAT
jgi:hypothetical protein